MATCRCSTVIGSLWAASGAALTCEVDLAAERPAQKSQIGSAFVGGSVRIGAPVKRISRNGGRIPADGEDTKSLNQFPIRHNNQTSIFIFIRFTPEANWKWFTRGQQIRKISMFQSSIPKCFLFKSIPTFFRAEDSGKVKIVTIETWTSTRRDPLWLNRTKRSKPWQTGTKASVVFQNDQHKAKANVKAESVKLVQSNRLTLDCSGAGFWWTTSSAPLNHRTANGP